MKTRLITLIGFVLAAAFTRLIPHPWNFTAIGAMALFGGAYFESRGPSLLVPLAALFLTDLILGFHATMLYVYAAFALVGILGWTLHEKKTVLRVGAYSLVASSLFFLISNFGVWMAEPLYAKNFQGLIDCYVMAIPFFGNQIAGDLFYSAVLFGVFEYARRRVPALTASPRG
jgi:hypothetical protein